MLPGTQQLVLPGSITPTVPPDMVAALGKNDQKIYVVPSLGLVVVRQGNSAGSPRLAVSSFDTELWCYLMAAIQCRPLASVVAHKPVAFPVYPNPATRAAQMQVSQAAGTLKLLSSRGQVMRIMPVGPFSANGLTPGLYLLRWLDTDGQQRAAQRLIVQ